MRTRDYTFGARASDETDHGRGAVAIRDSTTPDYLTAEKKEKLDAIVKKLPRKDRRFIKHFFEGVLSLPQIAHKFTMRTFDAKLRRDEIVAKMQALAKDK